MTSGNPWKKRVLMLDLQINRAALDFEIQIAPYEEIRALAVDVSLTLLKMIVK
jgi:hypothetical protein